MSPIEGISSIRHFPRLGKIRLGIKVEGQRGQYPKALDYFNVPEEVKAIHGDKPKELPIMFPNDDLELIAPQWLKCYSYSQGLICRGNGRTCRRKVDVDTGDFTDKSTMAWEMADGICDPDHCPKIGDKQCRRIMNLLFILPDVPGLGVYQLDTSSFYSIVNLNSQLAPDGFLRHFTNGRIAFIPLILSVEPQEVNPPGVGRKTVHILNVRADVKLADIIKISRQRPAQVLLPTVQEDEPPDDLYPDEVIGGEGVAAAETATRENEGSVSGTPTPEAAYDRHFSPLDVPAQSPQESASEIADQHFAEQMEHDQVEPVSGTDKEVAWEDLVSEGREEPPPQGEPTELKQLELGEGKVGEAVLSSPGKSTKKPPASASAAEPAPEKGPVNIDLDWFNETLKHIHWTEDTTKTWLSSHFQVDTQGELTDILQRLTREQAKQFTSELNDRAARVQPGLFE